MGEQGFGAFRMMLGRMNARAHRCAEHDGTGEPPARTVAHAPGVIDHLIQRGANVKFYEDFPYVLQQGALEARIKDLGGAMEPAYVEMSEMLPIRLEAADFYTSQIQVNFGDRVRMHRIMEDYTHGIRPIQTVHLERYWTTR